MKYFTFIVLFISSLAYSQDDVEKIQPKVGLSATVQAEQFGLLVPVWLSDDIALVPSVRLNYADGLGTDLAVGLSLRDYLREGKVRPYFTPGVAALFSFVDDSEDELEDASTLDWVLGMAIGGEYFLDPRFSFGVELGLAGYWSDENSNRFGNPDSFGINTSAAVLVNVYF
ncbi:MAG: hypothetical protein AAGC47_01775 [Bacteroidota bacterium]